MTAPPGLLATVAPLFRTFCGLVCGFLTHAGKRTVCSMLAGAGLSRAWPHDRAHWFFSRARWNPDDLGLAVARLVVALLVPPGQPVTIAIDDSSFKRRGKKVWAASWFHDGSAPGPAKTGYGNNWVVTGIVVKLPVVSRPVAIPVLAKLVIKGTSSSSRLWLARRMAEAIAGVLPGRAIHVVADSAYAVERTIPFQPACQAIATAWYATAGHDPAGVADHRARAPWHTTKAQPSTADVLAKLRRVLIAARFRASHHNQPTPEGIHAIRLAWEDTAA